MILHYCKGTYKYVRAVRLAKVPVVSDVIRLFSSPLDNQGQMEGGMLKKKNEKRRDRREKRKKGKWMGKHVTNSQNAEWDQTVEGRIGKRCDLIVVKPPARVIRRKNYAQVYIWFHLCVFVRTVKRVTYRYVSFVRPENALPPTDEIELLLRSLSIVFVLFLESKPDYWWADGDNNTFMTMIFFFTHKKKTKQTRLTIRWHWWVL